MHVALEYFRRYPDSLQVIPDSISARISATSQLHHVFSATEDPMDSSSQAEDCSLYRAHCCKTVQASHRLRQWGYSRNAPGLCQGTCLSPSSLRSPAGRLQGCRSLRAAAPGLAADDPPGLASPSASSSFTLSLSWSGHEELQLNLVAAPYANDRLLRTISWLI